MAKRIISLVLCAMLALCALPLAAAQESADYDPVIILQGYGGPQLYYDLGGEDEQYIWGVDNNNMSQAILSALPGVFLGLFLKLAGFPQLLETTLNKLAAHFLEPLSMNPDGSSKHNVSPYPTGAANTSYTALKRDGNERLLAEPPVSYDIMEYVDEDEYFTFVWDWRQSQVDSARQLNDYIKEVKQLTGSEKVDIYGLSHGGQLGATYLFYYGLQGDVDNAVLNVPAIGGSTLAADIMYGKQVNFDFGDIAEFAQIGQRTELEIQSLVEALVPHRFVNDFLLGIVQKYLFQYLVYIGSVWDLVPVSEYETLKEKYLDPVECAELIAKSDEMHNNVMKNMGEALRRVKAAGVDVSIMTNTGRKPGTGSDVNSDYIVDARGSSGALCAVPGERFAQDYAQCNTSCTVAGHNHISPAFDIDASCAYLPENTWFTNEQYHGQVHWDSHTHDLYLKLLLTDELEDVWSDKEFPQFESSRNPADTVHFAFDNSRSGYLDKGDKALKVKNTSEKYAVRVTSVECSDPKLKIECGVGITIPVGGSAELAISGELPQRNRQQVEITVNFVQLGAPPLFKSRTLVFTAFG